MYLASGTSAVVDGSIFHSNSAATGVSGNGGAIYLTTSADASLTVTDTIFSKNTANYGGAVYVAASAGTVNLSFDNCTFTASDTTDSTTIAATRNAANSRGGIMYMTDTGATLTLDISNSYLAYGDSGIEGGGLNLNNLDSVTISDSVLELNTGTRGRL